MTCREEHCMRGEKKEEELRWGKSNIEWREERGSAREIYVRWGRVCVCVKRGGGPR